MEHILFRFAKSVSLFAVTYFSLIHLGVGQEASIIVGLIPLVLGFINVMTELSFSIAAFIFVISAISSLLPSKYKHVAEIVSNTFDVISLEKGGGNLNK